ncbi:MAG: PD40 domain-containing protein [Melioribacteraceae bacterium]|nr:PD40 domain-containing protein [Melioribacteraceae bacterium]
MRNKSILLILAVFLCASKLFSQYNEFEPEYNWLTIKGEHVFVHFHEEAERTAKLVAKIADEVWDPITKLYEYDPGPVHFVIKDIDDYSNGATFFFDNKIEIWASALDFDLRGSHNWLRNVISHEFTHMVQIQASMKTNRSVPAFYLQYLNYEDKRRPDILYGFPNFIVSYPVPSVNIPAWFAEGTAQYMRTEFNYDNWDTHRDMILRCYALDGNMLTWNQMGVFNKTSLGNESVYNSGFALTRYIAQKYGEDKLREITNALGKFTNFTIDAAFEDVLGKDGNEIYDEWSSFLKYDYKERMKDVLDNPVQGDMIASVGFGNFYPVFSADGSYIYYISNKGSDYFGLSGIYRYDLNTKEEISITSNVRSSLGVSPDGEKIYYAKLSEHNPKWNNIHDLYEYDIKKDDEKRLTYGIRANNPSLSHDGKKITFIFQKDGTSNIGIVDSDGSNFKRLTFFENGEQVFNPKFSPDNKSIFFGYSYHQTRDIAKVETDGSGLEFIIQTDADERNPFITDDGSMVYSSDKSGIFNLYRYDFKNKESIQLTNVVGGAFMPEMDNNGNIVYAGYTSTGYKIFYLPDGKGTIVNSENHYVWINNPPLNHYKPNGDIDNFNLDRLVNFNDRETPDYEIKPYSGFFSRMSFFPFIRFDNYNISNSVLGKIKPGVYLASNDYLNRYSLFAGISINKNLERDAYLSFEYRNKLPLIYDLGLTPQLTFELYSVSRETDVDIYFGEYVDSAGVTRYDYIVPTDVTYNLFEVDFAARHKIFAEGNEVEFRFIYSDYVATLGSFIIPNEKLLYPTTNDKYLIGRNLQFKYRHKMIIPTIDTDINPVGRDVEFQYNYEFNKFNNDGEYEVADGILKPLYNNYNFHRLELNWKEYFQLYHDYTLTAQLRVASILGPAVPDFFDYYLGGLTGMKSYPFYSVSGNELGWFNLTYRFPLLKNIDQRVGHLYVDKIYMSVFADFGNAWSGALPGLNDFKKGAGAEIRIKMNSFYLFPTSLFFNAAYSFDKYVREVRGEQVEYGKEWRFYGGVLFDFSF